MKQTKQRLLHHVTISVFSKPHEAKEDVLKGLDIISPVPTGVLLQQDPEYDQERPKTIHYRMPDVEFIVQRTDTDEGEMTIYTLFFKKMSAVNHFAKQLRDAMTKEEVEEFRDDPQQLLDNEGNISCRLDKELLIEGKMVLTNDGNCYQVKASVAAYPKNAQNIIAAVERILQP